MFKKINIRFWKFIANLLHWRWLEKTIKEVEEMKIEKKYLLCEHVFSNEREGIWNEDVDECFCKECLDRVKKLREKYGSESIPTSEQDFLVFCKKTEYGFEKYIKNIGG